MFTNKTPLGRDVIGKAPRLRYVGVLATGYNVVDTAAAAEQGIPVSNIPTYGTQAVAQMAIAVDNLRRFLDGAPVNLVNAP